MKPFYELVIPSIAFLLWAVLAFTVIPVVIRHLKKKAEQTRYAFDEILISVGSSPYQVGKSCYS